MRLAFWKRKAGPTYRDPAQIMASASRLMWPRDVRCFAVKGGVWVTGVENGRWVYVALPPMEGKDTGSIFTAVREGMMCVARAFSLPTGPTVWVTASTAEVPFPAIGAQGRHEQPV